MIPSFQIGCDIVQIKRIRPSIAYKILTLNELQEYEALSGNRAIEYLAGHFAAKEAIIKAIEKSITDFQAIEIQYDQNGKPYGFVDKKTICLSISHEKDYAMAIAFCISSQL
jgi:holo-[acyl-carrier protein] synthase